MTSIPKIIHQIWIGTKPAPTKLMDTWKDKNPDFTYIRWNEKEIKKRKLTLNCSNRINEIEEINGKADIIRWEILYEYGGVFLDADSICIEPIDDVLMSKRCFAGWENEDARPGLVATGTMGFPPKHPLVKNAIDWIRANEVSYAKTTKMAWHNVGPGLLTRMYDTKLYPGLHVFPSYTFLPYHFTNREYTGHGKIYAYQEWGSTRQSYESMNNVELQPQFLPPTKEKTVSVLISSFNTKAKYIQECLESIKAQQGHFNMELIWINDGSNELNTTLLKNLLDNFQKTTRFIKVVYIENDGNRGLGYTFNRGNILCNNKIIFRMDSDDIMVPNRLKTQIEYMVNNPQVMICGGQVNCFNSNGEITSSTNHKSLSLEEFKKNPSHWFLNHPTVCYRKSAVLEVGNYNINISRMAEDFELWLRLLKKYGYIHNMSEVLLNYRTHDDQVTHGGGKEGRPYWHNLRNEMIQNIIYK
jgi:GT2 family glycosyltransferase